LTPHPSLQRLLPSGRRPGAGKRERNVTIKDLSDPRAWVENLVQDFIHSPENTLKNPGNEKAFEGPLVGFSKGDDPLYQAYKAYVGPFHWTPLEIFRRTFPELELEAGELTVISWILPQTRRTKDDNRRQAAYPSERWARARIYGEEVNVKLRKHVVSALNERGCKAVAPLLSPDWRTERSERYVFASTWSERHAAYASGLGTFGLCDGLITPRGKAMRTGSVVAHIRIPPTPRPYADHHAYCLYFTQGICGKCMTRCPVNAISESGHDKVKCLQHLKPRTAEYVMTHYGFDGYGCGLCQTGVPCESKIPTREDVDTQESA
jgi:epoxyqueuosine reductase